MASIFTAFPSPDEFIATEVHLKSAQRVMMSAAELNRNKFRILNLLDVRDESLRTKDVTSALCIVPSSVSTELMQLEKRALIARLGNGAGAAITPAGRRAVASAKSAYDAMIQAVLEELKLDRDATLLLLSAAASYQGKFTLWRDGVIDANGVFFEHACRIKIASKASAKSQGLSERSFLILCTLAQQTMTPSDIAATLLLPQSKTAHALGELQEAGLVERSSDRLDKRRKPISITPDGIAVMKAVGEAFNERYQHRIASVDDDIHAFYSTVAPQFTACFTNRKFISRWS